MKLFGDTRLYFGLIIPVMVTACGGGDTTPTNTSGPTILASVNSAAREAGPEVSANDLELFYHSDRAGGLGDLDIYVSTRADASGSWGNGSNLGANINSTADDRAPTISADGLTLIFASDRPGGQGVTDLYQSTRASINDAWGASTNLGSVLNTQYIESGPSISSDGLSLFFQSDRPGGFGQIDIYVSTRPSTSDPWLAPVNLGSSVNTSDHDLASDISSDGLTLYFHSTRAGGIGEQDIWKVVRSNTSSAWGAAEVLPAPVNTTAIEAGPSISANDATLYFASDRSGSDARDIWQVSR